MSYPWRGPRSTGLGRHCGGSVKPGVFQPAGQHRQRHLCLDPGPRRAEAVVDAPTEAEVLVVGAVGVE
jgi:hypothetical protein